MGFELEGVDGRRSRFVNDEKLSDNYVGFWGSAVISEIPASPSMSMTVEDFGGIYIPFPFSAGLFAF
jgi:hypothetical protein